MADEREGFPNALTPPLETGRLMQIQAPMDGSTKATSGHAEHVPGGQAGDNGHGTPPASAAGSSRRGLGASVERAFTVAGFFVLTKAVLTSFEFGGLDRLLSEADGSRITQIAAGLVYGVAFMLLLPRLGLVLPFVRRNKALVFLVLVALVSASWSIDPQLSLRRGLGLGGTTVFAIYVAVRFDTAEVIRLLGRALFLVAVASWVFVMAIPDLGIHHDHHDGSWRGAFLHKNQLGVVMGLGITAFLLLALELSRRWVRTFWIVAWLLGAILVLGSGSRTGWILASMGLISIVVLRALRQKPSVALAVLWLGVLAVGAPFMVGSARTTPDESVDTVLGALDRSDSLTGRVPLWHTVAEDAIKRPWLGYGYRAYWDTPEGPSKDVQVRVGWGPTHGHNGYLDLWVDIGALGLGAFALSLMVVVFRMVATFGRMTVAASVWIPVAIVSLLIASVAESSVLQRNSLLWVLYTVAAFHLVHPSTYEDAR